MDYKKIFIFLLLTVPLVIGGTYYFLNQKQTKKLVNLQDITLKLKWVHQAQFAGNYVAQERGFYADQGLNVKLDPFVFGEPVIEAVVKGEAEFGITSALELVKAVEKGTPIKAIAVIFRTSPDCAYSLKGSNIKKPQDFLGKTVGIQEGISGERFYCLMMSRLKIDRKKVNEVYIGYDATELINGETDVSIGYVFNEPQQAIQAGHEVNIMMFSDYGVDIYSDILFTTNEIIENNPQLAQKFVTATLDGWNYAIENEKKAIDDTLMYATNQDRAHEEYILEHAIPLVHTGTNKVGSMEDREWESVINTVQEQCQDGIRVNINDVYTSQFTEN